MLSYFDLAVYPEAIQIPPAQLATLSEQLLANATDAQLQVIADKLQGRRLQQFHKSIIGSRFVAEQLCKHPHWFTELLSGNYLDCPWPHQQYQQWFEEEISLPLDQWDKHLRLQRNKAMVRIIWRDFNRIANTQETTAELTSMAEAAIQSTLAYHYHHLSVAHGIPKNTEGAQQSMLVIGMGKLGAWELNLSSDVDLIFAYPESGDTQHCDDSQPQISQPIKTASISNQEFFTKLGQKIIQSLDRITVDGFVFRVDMRLRPYGQSGPLVSNFNSLEDYYQYQGREWERFAMIKARVIAQFPINDNVKNLSTVATNKIIAKSKTSHPHLALMKMLREFTYRRYVDFSAIEALRNLKQLIQREVKRRKLDNNIKLGAGGIREVEFIAQAFQIIRGGRDSQLQNRKLLEILPLLPKLNCLPPEVDQQLSQAYLFLRNTEHAIQGFQDKQTQELPMGKQGLDRIAFILGYNNAEAFSQQLQHYRELIHQQFNTVIASKDHEHSSDSATHNEHFEAQNDIHFFWQSLNKPNSNDEKVEQDQVAQLKEHHFDDPEKSLGTLKDLLRSSAILAMEATSRRRLDALMPRLLLQLSHTQQPTQTLERISTLILAIARRSAYLLLLTENPQALSQLVTLSQASPWIANNLAQHPALLDELLNPTSLYAPPHKLELRQDLQQQMLRVEKDDLEGQMEGLRYFRSAHSLRVAASEVSERLPLMKVSDYLSELAEVICEYSLQLAWHEMITRHGYPDGEIRELPNFIIVAYGKLGGIELGHNSDLDLVFIHNASSTGETTGIVTDTGASPQRVIDNYTFYTRLGQKIIHMLSTLTPAGQLYEIDMRLRPSGNSGLLTTSLQAFEKYQMDSAWTWEHQALVRARPIAGCPELMTQFHQLRREILCKQRPLDTLKKEVVDMRQKMRSQLGSSKKQQEQGLFQLKQDSGGIVDIEFMVQYAVLAWARTSSKPEFIQYTDNIRLLEGLKEGGQFDAKDAEHLVNIYKIYRSKGHKLALQQQSSLIDINEFAAERLEVQRIWQTLLG